MTTKPVAAAAGKPAVQPGAAQGKRKRLAPSQKYEMFTSVLTSSATQRELSERFGVRAPAKWCLSLSGVGWRRG